MPVIRREDRHGLLHCDNGPALYNADGSVEWYQHGKLHRDDGPAVFFPNEYLAWYQHGRLHRLDGPAVTYSDGRTEWWIDGVHRLDLGRPSRNVCARVWAVIRKDQ